MSTAPKAVIHINFLPGELLFDPRPMWSALNNAVRRGKFPTVLSQQLGQQLGGTAIHLGTRDYIMRAALRELKAATLAIRELIPNATEINSIPNTRVVSG